MKKKTVIWHGYLVAWTLKKRVKRCTNVSLILPLIRSPPTDYMALYILYWSDKSVQYRNVHDRNSGTFKMAEKYGRHYIKLCFLIFCSIDNVILTSFGLEVEDRFYPRSILTLGTIGGLTVRGFRLVIS
jgi:hypothetical protein